MAETQDFLDELEAAAQTKAEYINEKMLPAIVYNYQLLATCVKNMYDVLIRRSLIKEDPYKFDKKISEIKLPDDSPFSELDRANVMGARLSDYDSMLEFICTYYKFSLDALDLEHIKELEEFNACIDWTNFSATSGSVNTRSLATLLNEARSGADSVLNSLINDSVSKSTKAAASINADIREIEDFQRECYKINVRRKILQSSAFNQSAFFSLEAELAEIRRLFPELIGRQQPFYGDLIQEIVKEDASSPGSQLRANALRRLSIGETRVGRRQKGDTRGLLLDAVLILSALAPQYEQVVAKVQANHEVLSKERVNIFEKIRNAIRKLFHMKAAPERYRLVITNQKTGEHVTRIVEYESFTTRLQRKYLLFQAVANVQSPEYRKIMAATDEMLLNFVNRQISDNQEILTQLAALDEYFKTRVAKQNQSKIRGLKIEIVAMKNTLIKTNQKRAEYISSVEETAQLEELGMSNAN